ncbi:MAG: PSD1 and planctomycete cytochrome C domain-containing protein [Gemmataceae bacterium]|nr:PSD1 and planctomycete cytochrome C domain-containing protein [Gemmataceae bacterium]
MSRSLLLFVVGFIAAPSALAADKKIEFNRDVRPVLADKCFACHGLDTKKVKGDLRLDVPELAKQKNDEGNAAIVPGKPDTSEAIRRITSKDPSKIMPPPSSKKTLTEAEKQLLKDWIAQGAEYQAHWAYVAPVKPPLPVVKHASWPNNPIDHFILARLEKEGLTPNGEAALHALIRRVTLDLTGLPPTPVEVDDFLKDCASAKPQAADRAYEKVVDRLLKSPRYGEHMARFWLDAARYGDTHGMHLDNYREMFPYRDWVIRAFNHNMPFNRFLIEQIAGDLLPNASVDQKVATGFLRCHVTTSEGGSIEEEVYVRNVVDRTDTNGLVLFGLTVGCARCHNHPYDPVSAKEYYQLFAFFNNLDGSPLDGNIARHPPVVSVPTAEQAAALAKLNKEIAALERAVKDTLAKVKYDPSLDAKAGPEPKHAEHVWIDDALPGGVKALVDNGTNVAWNFVDAPAPVKAGGKSIKLTHAGLGQVVLQEASPGLRVGKGDKLFAHVYIDSISPPTEIMLQWHTDTWRHRAYWGENVIPWGADNTPERRRLGDLPAKGEWVRLEVDAAHVGIKPGMVINGWAFTLHGGTAYWDQSGLVTKTPQSDGPFETLTAWLQYQRSISGKGLPKPLQDIVKLDPKKHNDEQKKKLLDYFVEHTWSGTRALLAPVQRKLTPLVQERDKLDKEIPTTLVFKERADQRPAYFLKRGEYEQRGDKVERGTPAFLPPLPTKAPRDRRGFAEWLVDPKQPLTARVAVNRFWQQLFGTGLVKTAEDFGVQGELPSHPELLDWLALTFVEDNWDVQKLMKRLVMSATYRQSARVTSEHLAKDPQNRLLARGPRFRLDAEMLRDQALFVSGLLVEKTGGPSVKPPQPEGLWRAVAFTGSNTGIFKADTGHDKVHRRSMYIFWKRTAAPPMMTALDAPSREACVVRRERTNTPLQALLLMNEQQYVEASRVLAERTLKSGGATPESRLQFLFKSVTSRPAESSELVELQATLQDHMTRYAQDPKAAQALIAVGETKADPALNPSELAAWTLLANLVLNLDEVVTK